MPISGRASQAGFWARRQPNRSVADRAHPDREGRDRAQRQQRDHGKADGLPFGEGGQKKGERRGRAGVGQHPDRHDAATQFILEPRLHADL